MAHKNLGIDTPRLCQVMAECSPLPTAALEGDDHRVTYVNPALCRLRGMSKEELLGTALADAGVAGEGLRRHLDQVYRSGQAEIHLGQEPSDLPPVYQAYALWPVFSQDGQQAGIIFQVIETAASHQQAIDLNQALLISSVRQHELAEAAENREAAALEEQHHLAEQVQSTGQELDRTKEELRALAASLLTAQEDERRRIARELHDDVSQRLTGLQVQLELLRQEVTPGATLLAALADRVAVLSSDVRRLSHRLHPAVLEMVGLEAALRSLCEEGEQRLHRTIRCICPRLSRPVSLPVATVLYRIAQEALRNVQKHAGGARVNVILEDLGPRLCLTIADDGVGFDPAGTRHNGGLGMISMHERAALLGGRVEIRSALGQGTTVAVSIPWPEGP